MANKLDLLVLEFKKIPGLKVTKAGKLAVASRTISNSENAFTILFNYLPDPAKTELITNFTELYMDLVKPDGDALFRAQLIESLKALKVSVYKVPTVVFDAAAPCCLTKIKVIQDFENFSSSFLFNPETEEVYNVDVNKVLPSIVAKHFPEKEDRARWMAEHTDSRLIRYKPFQPKLYEDDSRMVFNKWAKPAYLLDWEPDPSVTNPPEEFSKVFEHLFPNPSERPHVLSWMREALFGRESTVLILTGVPGCGKGVLTYNVLGNLVGLSNWTKAAANFEDSQFHGDIRGRTVFVLNEIKLGKKTKDKLKDFADGIATLNEKHVRNVIAEDIHASFVLTNNYPSHNWLEYSDRKFYVPELANEKLDDKYGKAWVTNFCETVTKDPAFLKTMASYLYCNFTKQVNYPKTETFYTICRMCLPAYFKKFLLLCENKKEFSEKDLDRVSKFRRPINVYELKETLETYQRETGKKVAELVEGVSGWIAHSYICKDDSSDSEDLI
jgi:hypothetical protein